MGKIHEVQAELIECIRERNRLMRELEQQRNSAEDYHEQFNQLLVQRPAPLKPGWKMPEARCSACGSLIRPEVYIDVNEVYLNFAESCEECDHPFDFEAYEIEWPFTVNWAWLLDFERIGFEVV